MRQRSAVATDLIHECLSIFDSLAGQCSRTSQDVRQLGQRIDALKPWSLDAYVVARRLQLLQCGDLGWAVAVPESPGEDIFSELSSGSESESASGSEWSCVERLLYRSEAELQHLSSQAERFLAGLVHELDTLDFAHGPIFAVAWFLDPCSLARFNGASRLLRMLRLTPAIDLRVQKLLRLLDGSALLEPLMEVWHGAGTERSGKLGGDCLSGGLSLQDFVVGRRVEFLIALKERRLRTLWRGPLVPRIAPSEALDGDDESVISKISSGSESDES